MKIDVKEFVKILGRLIGWGPESGLARPSFLGTGRKGKDGGTEFVRHPRAHGESEPEQQRPGRHHPAMPTVEEDPMDFQPSGGEEFLPKRQPPPFRSGDEGGDE
jgi:hypothetical protein